MATKKEYGNESLRLLKGADRIRLAPNVMFGSANIEGCEHSFFEILSNSLDEFKAGYGDTIEVVREKDNTLSIRDYGRGCPVDFNKKENCYNWEIVYCELWGGGKYDSDVYNDQLGIHGLGSASTQFASEFFDVCVVRDGYEYTLHFEKGENIGGLKKKKAKDKPTGTYQRWKPDSEVFFETNIPLEYFTEILKIQSIVNKGVHIKFKDELNDFEEEYYAPEGILGFLKEESKGAEITTPVLFEASGSGKDKDDRESYDVSFQIAFCFNNAHNGNWYFHNSSPLEYGGSPAEAMKIAFTNVIDKQITIRNGYQKAERKIKFDDIKDSLLYISNSFSSYTSYANQTKKSIDNIFIKKLMIDKISEGLEVWFLENKIEADKVVEQILANKRSAESAERIRVATKKKLMSKMDTMKNRVKKFTPCRSNDNSITELFICEGDSAKTSIIEARDSEFQAIMPIRGKILNCLKADMSAIMKSDIIMDLIKVLGCGMDIKVRRGKGNSNTFDINNLRWSKVIIATDSDYDGWQIRTLVLTMLYRLTPELIKQGYVYIAETPLFEITTYEKGKEETLYAFSDGDVKRIVAGLNGKKYKLQRSKGLGENTPEMMRETTLGPEGRHLVKVTPESMEKMNEKFELLLGSNVQKRKEYIEKTGHLWLDGLDI